MAVTQHKSTTAPKVPEPEVPEPQEQLPAPLTKPVEADEPQSVRLPPFAEARVNSDLTRNIMQTGWLWWAVLGFFAAVTGWAVLVFSYQVYDGVGVYGNNRPVYWAIPIINFVFWAGVALSGTMISAILRLFHVGWRRSLTRMTETLTLCALAVAGLFPLLHLGRNWVFYFLVPYPNERQLWPNYKSPLLWDASAISVYLITSALFWYVGLMPDFAVLRARTLGWRRALYTALSLGWRGRDREWRRLKVLSGILTVMIIPVFVSLHTIVGWDFGMSLVPGWHENIFAPYFVCGALFSGCGAVLIIMYLVRRAYHLESYILPQHFDNISKILFSISLLWFYFFAGDAWADWFSNKQTNINWLDYAFGGYRSILLLIIGFGILVPYPILAFKKARRSPLMMLLLGISVNIAMFSERVMVVIPMTSRNVLTWGNYTPSWADVSLTAGAVGLFGFLYTLLTKFIPMISLWEYKEGGHVEWIEESGNGSVLATVREDTIG